MLESIVNILYIVFAMDIDNSDNNPKVWYKFYGQTLLNAWNNRKEKRTKERLYEILAVLHKIGCTADVVQQNFNRNRSIPQKLLDGVLLLLIDTDFYLSFLDVGMLPRADIYNSERVSRKYYENLKIMLAETDDFWGRWVTLHELRYQSTLLSNEEKEKKYLKIFDEYKSPITEKKFFTEELKKLKEIEPKLAEHIQYKMDILNLFYKLCFNLSYRSWIKNSIYYVDKEEFFNKIHPIDNSIKDSFDEIEKKLSENPLLKEKFYYDFRIHELYYKGSKLIGSETKPFIELSQKKRMEMVKTGKKLLEETIPNSKDNLQYRVWHKYYHYLNVQREAENLLLDKNYIEGLEKYKEAYSMLKEMESQIAGGFFTILLKIKYQKRGVSYIINSMEAFLLEKQLEDPYGYEYRLNEERQKSRDSTFDRIQEWMINLRKDIFSF